MGISPVSPDTYKLVWRGTFYSGISPTRKKKLHVGIKCVVRSMAAMICSMACGKIGIFIWFYMIWLYCSNISMSIKVIGLDLNYGG